MMHNRNLFKEISKGKYHSAIFTSYSFNMYYWDIQVAKTLRNKGIEHISAIVDDNCLSEQFNSFCMDMSSKRAKGYSIHGYRSILAFHPKIIFLAGQNSILAFIGSGNVTSSGHGLNLEVWTPIAIESVDDAAYPLICDIWSYISSIYSQLGEEARRFSSAVYDNCQLLYNYEDSIGKEYLNIDGIAMKFMSNYGSQNIFNQISKWVNDDKISDITIMTPFYDGKNKLINELNNKYHPQKIRLIYQNQFGSVPSLNNIPLSVEMYNWNDCLLDGEEKGLKRDFHAKCIVLKGDQSNYMFVGSANASLAALGGEKIHSLNHEAIIAFKSKDIDFWHETGVKLGKKSQPTITDTPNGNENKKIQKDIPIWLQEVTYSGNTAKLVYSSKSEYPEISITFYSSTGEQISSYKSKLDTGSNISISIEIKYSKIPLFAVITDSASGIVLSNKQFAISSVAMADRDPSPISLEFRRRCHDIENGNIINSGVCKFLSDVCLCNSGSAIVKASKTLNKQDKGKTDDQSKSDDFTSYFEYKKGVDESLKQSNIKYTNAIRREQNLLGSILAFIKNENDKKASTKYDSEEDTEDTRYSSGKDKTKSEIIATPAGIDTLKKIAKKLHKIFVDYIDKLVDVIESIRPKIDELTELNKAFLSMLVIGGYLNYHKALSSQTEDKITTDLPIKFTIKGYSITEILYSITSLYGLLIIKANSNQEDSSFMSQGRKRMFELGCTLLSVCDILNKDNPEYYAIMICKNTALLNLATGSKYDLDSQSVSKTAEYLYDYYGGSILKNCELDSVEVTNAISANLQIIKDAQIVEIGSNKTKKINSSNISDFILFHKELGYLYAQSFIKNSRIVIPLSCTGLYDPITGLYKVFKEYIEQENSYLYKAFDIDTGKEYSCR